MKTLYMIMGNSGAGKDTAGEWLVNNRNATVVKFAAPGKRALEFMLKVEPGLLDDREKRQKIAPYCQGRTYLQVLIDFWRHRDLVIGGDLFTGQTMEQIHLQLGLGKNIAITDCRNFDEASAIHLLAKRGKINLVTIWLIRGVSRGLDSDIHQKELFQKLSLAASSKHCIINDHGVTALYQKLQDRITL